MPRSLAPLHKRLIVKLVHAVTGLLNNTSSRRNGGVALSLAHAALHATIHALCPSMMSCIFFFPPGARLGICRLPVAMATEAFLINNAARHAEHINYINSYQTLKAALPLVWVI